MDAALREELKRRLLDYYSDEEEQDNSKKKPRQSPHTTAPSHQGNSDSENIDEDDTDKEDEKEDGTTGLADIVLQEDNIGIHLKETAILKLNDLNINDVMFVAKLSEVGAPVNEPMLSSIKAINTLFVEMFKRLAHLFDTPNSNREFFVTICDRSMRTKSINLKRFDPLTQSPEVMGDKLGASLYNYLQSAQTLKINESFRIFVVAVSPDHVTHLNARNVTNGSTKRKPGKPKIVDFCNKQCFRHPVIGYPVNQSTKGLDKIWKGKCALVSFICSYHFARSKEFLSKEEKSYSANVFKLYAKKSVAAKIEGCRWLQEELSKLEALDPSLQGTNHKLS